MEPRKIFIWSFLYILLVSMMSTGCQAQGLTEINASDILDKIKNGEDIYLQNVHIVGDFNLSKVELETLPSEWSIQEIQIYNLDDELKLVETEIKIIDSVFENDVILSNAQFKNAIDFQNTSFLGKTDFRGTSFIQRVNFHKALFVNFSNDVNFRDASFNDTVDFSYSKVSGYADFSEASFGSSAYFHGSTFDDIANFMYASFNNYTDFSYSTFNDEANFFGTTFGNYANFSSIDFNGCTDFSGVDFNGYADFFDASFNGDADFFDASFNGDADFFGVDFNGDVNFFDASFNGDADFSGVDFNGDADFSSVDFNGDADFRYVKFGYVDFSWTGFNKNVDFYNIDFQKMVVAWNSLEDGLTCDGLVYIKLIKNFRDRESFDDAERAYYQYRKQSRKNENWPSWVLSIIMDLTCGYGVKPFNAVFFGGLTILGFTFIYWRKNGISRLKENDRDKDQSVTFWDALYFSSVTFTTVGYGDWYPKDRYRKFVMIEGLLGWLILALFLVTLANVVIRP